MKYWFAFPPPACWATTKPGVTARMSAGRERGRSKKSRARIVDAEAAVIGRTPCTKISSAIRGEGPSGTATVEVLISSPRASAAKKTITRQGKSLAGWGFIKSLLVQRYSCTFSQGKPEDRG